MIGVKRTPPLAPTIPITWPGLAVFILGLVTVLTGCRASIESPAEGITRELARQRAEIISDLRYDISLHIPDSTGEKITGSSTITLSLSPGAHSLVLDFNPAATHLDTVLLDGSPVQYTIENGHIVLPSGELAPGKHQIHLQYRAGDGPLNRNPQFLYALFVPGRASEALPVFDQPDLRARFSLTLDVPEAWTAVSNTPTRSKTESASGVTYQFQKTPPLPTYLFSFAAGKFHIESAKRDGRMLTMYHQETDSAKVARNRETIFDLHAQALRWMEEYTDISYPFHQFSFVAIPGFQYGGMEHPGAILYRASSLFLDESTTQNQQLGRATLIAHETAHMWFGDLVSLEWFNDVWMKEVFASFLAGKIVHPSFPQIDHDLRFLLDHYPAAYSVDRTKGTHAIRQSLENQRNAGSLYGSIIYDKAPIVMRKLENLIGSGAMQKGLRQYLATYRWGNASWPDLIEVLDPLVSKDLQAWSEIWVEQAGRPAIDTQQRTSGDTSVVLQLQQRDPMQGDRLWPQELMVQVGFDDETKHIPVNLNQPSQLISVCGRPGDPNYIRPNGGDLGYGYFEMDEESLDYLIRHLPSIDSTMTRAVIWIDLWENMLEGRVEPAQMLRLALRSLHQEKNEQLIQQILGYLEATYWRYLDGAGGKSQARTVEKTLWRLMTEAPRTSLKSAYFQSYRNVSLTPTSLKRLRRVWAKTRNIDGLTLSTRDYTHLSATLALRTVSDWNEILDRQEQRIDNPDRQERFQFIRPALSNDPSVRSRFFKRLQSPENRKREPWVVSALYYLHHPLRSEQARQYVAPSLAMLEEVHRTGDIFFPLNWLRATFSGHNSPDVARIIREYLARADDLPPHLRNKVLQAADPVFRAARIVHGEPHQSP